MAEFFTVLGVLVFAIALRSFDNRFLRKLGALGILAASFLAFYLPTENLYFGIFGVSIWFLLPWVELLTRIRKMRLPFKKNLEKQPPPNASRFPSLNEFTNEIEDAGFEYVCDTGWAWDGIYQFYRVFYLAEEKAQAAICFTEQENMSWAYVSITSRHKDGKSFRSSNLPFSNPMKIAPDIVLRQNPRADNFDQLLREHRNWLDGLAYDSEDFLEENPEEIPRLIEEETGRQISHNLDSGLIAPAEEDEMFRYSWRGLFYLYFQLVKDMVKMC